MKGNLAPLVDIRDLVVEFKTERSLVHALNGVNLQIKQGESLGLVGEAGAGKTTTALGILNLMSSQAAKVKDGDIRYSGKSVFQMSNRELLEMRGGKVSMIFQNPLTSLNPVFTVGEQIAVLLRKHMKMNRRQAMIEASKLLEMVGISGTRVNDYPHQFSGGMRQRVGIAAALACRPELLIADEPTTALDVTIQAQILELMKELQKDFNMAILFITHDLGVVAKMCDRVAVMYLGKIVESADASEVYANPQHPYTRGLIGSVHKIGSPKEERLFSIEGTVPLAMNLPKACGFYDRCDARIEGLCNRAEPELVEIAPGHKIACFNCPHEACKAQRAKVEAALAAGKDPDESAGNGTDKNPSARTETSGAGKSPAKSIFKKKEGGRK
ncbi:MAG: ABC transporter ATP-binding protein [Lachnospiraceae bacterium]|nr:ABC transporter ATP-binding protein [Lachnospiraceae bacterium]